jgi:tetratricopeptide (TPR) repeat protein
MAHWKAQTLSGNRHFDAGEYARALDCYQQALWLARQQFADWHDADEAVAALVVAHHNLADLLVAMTLPDRAADLLCHIHDCLLATSQSPPVPLPCGRRLFATPAAPVPSCSPFWANTVITTASSAAWVNVCVRPALPINCIEPNRRDNEHEPYPASPSLRL